MAQTLSLDLLLFYAHGQLRGLDPQLVALMGEAFYIFQAECFKKWKSFNKKNTRFHITDTNKLVFDVQCKYSNIVNNKKNIQHCMLKWLEALIWN